MAKIDLYSKDWCELIFANRNKKYGAYQLRAESGERNSKALITLFIIIALAVGIPLFFTYVIPHKADNSVTNVTNLAKLEEAKVKDKHIIKKVEPNKLNRSASRAPLSLLLLRLPKTRT